MRVGVKQREETNKRRLAVLIPSNRMPFIFSSEVKPKVRKSQRNGGICLWKMINVHHMYNKSTTPLSHGESPLYVYLKTCCN
jgi:hypothetical protein